MKSRARHRLTAGLIAMVVAVATTISLVSLPAQASVAPEVKAGPIGVTYVRENSVSYRMKSTLGTYANCNGYAWIGQTETNWIQAYTTVSCGGRWFKVTSETFIKKAPNSLQWLARNYVQRTDVSSVYAPTSVYGSYYGQYCVHGRGDVYNGNAAYSGYGIVCIYT